MGDFELTHNAETQLADIGFEGIDFTTDDGLQTAVLISLFSDRRAEPEDVELAESRRGWWGDTFEDIKIGSRLWLLDREKQTQETLNRAQEYAEEALAWLIEENVAREIEVSASYPDRGRLDLEITIYKATGEEISYKFDANWNREVS